MRLHDYSTLTVAPHFPSLLLFVIISPRLPFPMCSFGPSREEIFRGMAALRRIISKFTSLAATAASPSASRASPERAPTLRPADAAAPIEPSRK